MANIQSKVASLEERVSKLIAENTEIRKKYSEIEVKKTELERDARVEELEQKNIELENRLAILEQGKKEKSISTEDISHSPVNSNDTPKQIVPQCDESDTRGYATDTPISDITDNTLNSNDTHEQIVSHNEESKDLSSDNNSSEQSNLCDIKTVTLETNPKDSTEDKKL
ncbi:10815_t:CDS:2 [Entrophospora sp. SA101]|nr:10815_t:CDS:2 [Entrophospora sp. SA101]